MQLTRPLLACALLAPLAARPAPPVLSAGESREPVTLSVRLGYLQQFDQGGIEEIREDATAYQGLIGLDAPVSDRDRLTARALVDVVSSASIRREHNASWRALQSGASGVVHASGRLGYTRRFDGATLSVHGSGSWDYAYLSVGGGAAATVSLLDDNATLHLGVDGAADTLAMIRFNGTDEADQGRWTVTARLGWSHVLTPLTVLSAGVDYTAQGGFLAGQFNSVFVGAVERAEVLPTGRHRLAATLRLKQGLGWRHAFELGARYYGDDWALHAGTVNAGYEVWLDRARRTRLRLGYRFHAQSAVAWYSPRFAAAAPLMTSDPDLGDFYGHLPSLGLTFRAPFGPAGGDLDLDANYYARSNGIDLLWFSLGWSIQL